MLSYRLNLPKVMSSTDPLNILLPKFIKSLEDKKRSPSTIVAYKADLSQMVDFFVKRNKPVLSLLTQTDIEAFRDTLALEKYTPKSVSRKLNAIKTFFRWLFLEKYIGSNPAEYVSHPKIDTTMPKFLSPLEYRALRDVVREDIRIYAITEIILQTGLRISEVAALKRENYDDNSLTVEAYATQPQRKISLNKPAKEAIEKYLKERPQSDSPYVFVSKNGKPLAVRNIRAAIDRYMQRAQIQQYSVNDLRTTFVVENIKAGVNLVLISQIAGHKRISTTERYLELAGVTEPGKKQQLIEL